VLSNSKARDLFGPNAEASTIPLSGLIAPVFDNRVLADSGSCWVTNGNDQPTIILYHREGGDAHARYQKEHDAAQPVSEDKGNGLTVTSEGYFDKTSDPGDEAFCTGTAFTGATVLMRQGDQLLYVSIQPGPDEFDPSQLGINRHRRDHQRKAVRRRPSGCPRHPRLSTLRCLLGADSRGSDGRFR
jgi:hypothetical protein